MEIIRNPTQAEINGAAQALKDGHLVAFPTETVYGLGADATNEKAVSRIYSVKGRPTDHPLIVHISSINQLGKWALEIPEYALRLARAFWPGPMTLILKRSEIAKNFITGSQENVGIRVPSHPMALALLTEFEKLGGLGIAAPSANRFGKVSPTSGIDVREELGVYLEEVDQILDGGRCLIGIESTIINCTSRMPEVLRPGFITPEAVADVFGINVRRVGLKNEIKTPGALPAHYMPKARVVTHGLAKQGEGFLALANIKTPQGSIRLANPSTVEEYAKQLYKALRLADQKGLSKVVVIPPKGQGLATAIRDRLKKAAVNLDPH